MINSIWKEKEWDKILLQVDKEGYVAFLQLVIPSPTKQFSAEIKKM